MSAYVLSMIDKKDYDKYAEYAAAGFASLQGIDFEVIVAEPPEVLEGEFPCSSMVMLKFNSMDEARRWYHSDAYQKAIPIRHAAAHTPFTILFPGNDEAKQSA
jgi:uncharacterized protein (DUF1330 family)